MKKKTLIIAGIAVVVIALVGYKVISSSGKESTENAQLDASITPIRAIVQGYITDLKFTDNQVVKKGDTLLIIDQHDYKEKVIQAKAALESANAQLELAKSSEQSAGANANSSSLNSDVAKDNISAAQIKLSKAEKEFNRYQKMLSEGSATPQQFEVVKADYETAKIQFKMVEKQYKASSSQATAANSQVKGQQSQIALATALVKQKEAELALAETQLANTVVTAPFNGIVSKKTVENMQYLQIGSPICSVVDIEHVFVSANFKETQIEDMKAGDEVEIKVDAYSHSKITGVLESFGGATGAKFSLLPPDNATGNFVKITQRVPVKISLKDIPAELTGKLMPGLSAYVVVHTK